MSRTVDGGDIEIRLVGRVEELNKALADAEGNMKKRFGNVANIAGKAMTAAGAAITGALGLAVNEATKFQTAMAEVNTLGVKDLGGLSDAVKDVSARFGLDLVDGAKAAYQAISAGTTEAQAPYVLEQAAKAAAAGVTDLTTSIELGTSVSNAFGLELENVNQVYDKAFIAVKNGVTNFEALASSVGKVAPLMAGAGLSADEMFASVAALTKAGINTAESVTAMKAALTNIIKPSQAAAELSDALGISFNSAALESKGLKGFLEEMNLTVEKNNAQLWARKQAIEAEMEALQAKQKLSAEEKTYLKELKEEYKSLAGVQENTIGTMSNLFGSAEALNAVIALTGKQSGDFADTLAEMNFGLDATDTAFRKLVEADPAFAWRQLKSEMNVLAVEIGTMLLPVLNDLVVSVKPVIASVRDWLKANPELGASIVKITGGVGALMAALGPFLMMLPGIATAVKGVGVAIGALLTPIGIVGAAIGAAVILWIKNWEEIKHGTQLIWMDITGFFGEGVTSITDKMGFLGEFLGTVWDGIKDVFASAWEFIGPIIEQILWASNPANIGGWLLGMNEGPSEGFSKGGFVKRGQKVELGEQGPEMLVTMKDSVPQFAGLNGPWEGMSPYSGWVFTAAQTRALVENMPHPYDVNNNRAWNQLVIALSQDSGAGGMYARRIVKYHPYLWQMAESYGLRPGSALPGYATGGVVGKDVQPFRWNEKGGEIGVAPVGTQILSTEQSQAMLQRTLMAAMGGQSGGGGGDVNVNINGPVVAVENLHADDPASIQRLDEQLGRKLGNHFQAIGNKRS